MNSEIEKLIADIDAQRDRAMELLNDITDDQLDYFIPSVETGGGTLEEGAFTIRRLIHRVITHHEDHLQHIWKTRRKIGKPRTETQRLLARLQVIRAELRSALIGLGDEDLTKDVAEGRDMGALLFSIGTYPEPTEVEELYTLKRIVQHIVEMEERRWAHVRQAMDLAVTK